MEDKSQHAVNVFNKWANEYQEHFMDVSSYASTLNFFCKNVSKQNASILELACGPGNITKHLLSQRPDLKILGADLAPNMVELAKKNNPDAEFEILDSRKISSLKQEFDGIMCGFCLPYLTKEEALKLIADAYDLLNPGGLLYISTMEDEYSKSGIKTGSKGDEIFIHYHEGNYLVSAIEKCGFKILSIVRQDFKNHDGTMAVDLIIVAQR